jgi:hypothetical protein
VNPSSQSSQIEARLGRYALVPNLVRFALAPPVLFFGGFFTTSFLISGQYTWSRTTQTVALTLAMLILSYEFVYKEHLSLNGSSNHAWSALLYSCVLPYVIGAVVVLALWVF